MAHTWLIPVFFLCSFVFTKADDCVAYNFEDDVDSFFGNAKAICSGLQLWEVGNYSGIGLEGPNSNSETFISASASLSCASSFDFSMTAGGIIEVNVYMDDGAANQISVLAHQNGLGVNNDAVAGTIMLIPSVANFVSGWQKLSFTLVGLGTFDGYLTFFGSASEGSLVVIDSFRYIPPGSDENTCVFYENETVTTTEKQSETTEDDGHEDCVTYNFETDFDIRFTTDNYLCDGFLPWHLDNYTSISIESPNPSSTVFMTPNEFSSCISSFVFKMSPEGIIEANVYMEPVSALDHIIVLAQRVTDKEYDTVAGFRMYYPEKHVFVNGWNVLRFSLLDLTSFEGYLIFIGSAEKDSTVLVDSVRYIPPETTPEDDSCILY